MYSVIRNDKGIAVGVLLESTGQQIPIDAGNRHYREFLAWNAQQSPPLSLDPITVQQLKSRNQLITDYAVRASLLSEGDRNEAWRALCRFALVTVGTPLSVVQFDAKAGASLSALDADLAQISTLETWTNRILNAAERDPDGFADVIQEYDAEYSPYVE